MSKQTTDRAGKGSVIHEQAESCLDPLAIKRPDPCLLASKQNPAVTLFLSLNCPRCGQLATLDQDPEANSCLAESHRDCHFFLYGDHHEYQQ